MRSVIVAPSLLSADFSEAGSAVKKIEESGSSWIHLDIMDGRFVPNISFGAKMVADLRKKSRLFFDVHLMTLEPDTLVDGFIEAGADAITFHVEACVHVHRLLQRIRGAGKEAGISMVPTTPLSMVEEALRHVDLVLVMTVNPGFGGQKLIPACIDKVARIRDFRNREGLGFKIAVDGGMNLETSRMAVEAGADVIVAGSAFFESDDTRNFVHGIQSYARADSSLVR
jgi:ribulose-phosphate 3-epimerase